MSSYVEYVQQELEWKEESRKFVNSPMKRSKVICLASTGFFLALFFLEMPALIVVSRYVGPSVNEEER